MINFNLIFPNKKSNLNLNTTDLKVRTNQFGKILFPYTEGKIISINQNECGGNIIISFNYNGELYTMNFCNIDEIKVSEGTLVKEGSVLGITNKNHIKVSILDSKNKKTRFSFFNNDKIKSSKYSDNETNPENVVLNTSLSPMSFAHDVFSDLLGLKPKLNEEITRIKELL